jgi:integrase
MIILMATYGLRGIEVIRLCLDDIDWRKCLICIKGRKAHNNTVYPLTSTVAQSLIQYLKEARASSSARQVFLTVKAPYKPLNCPNPLSVKVREYMKKAGVKVKHPGTHTFRYSCAQLLLKKGTALKVISDYLGHTRPETTRQYIKIAIDDLREVACGDGEEVLL